jgi:hypothetical protein
MTVAMLAKEDDVTTATETHRCEKHQFELAQGTCRKCGYPWCGDCIIFPFGPDRPALCVSCAVAVAGVRHSAGVKPRRRHRLRIA